MKIKDGEKIIQLEDLARQLCCAISGEEAGGCFDGSCPAEAHCRHGHNGMADWLREVIK